MTYDDLIARLPAGFTLRVWRYHAERSMLYVSDEQGRTLYQGKVSTACPIASHAAEILSFLALL